MTTLYREPRNLDITILDKLNYCSRNLFSHINFSSVESSSLMLHLQDKFFETPFPFSLIEKVIKMAAECNENKTKSQESKNTWNEKT